MIGFELCFNEKVFSGSILDGIMSIIATIRIGDNNDSSELTFGGMKMSVDNEDKYEQISWFEHELKEGDEFVISIKEIAQNSDIISSRKHEGMSDNDLLGQFYQLEQELINAGIELH